MNGRLRIILIGFEYQVDLFDQDSHETTARRLFREVDYMDEESSERMSIKLDTTSIDLGRVS